MPQVLEGQTIVHNTEVISNQCVFDVQYAGHQTEKIVWGVVELPNVGGYYVTKSGDQWITDIRY